MDHPRPWLRYVDADDLDDTRFNFADAVVVDQAGEKLGDVDGFIIDVDSGRPYHVVVEAGHWFKHKYFLIPIGHVGLDESAKRLTADVPKARTDRIPGFSRSDFEKLTDAEKAEMAQTSASAWRPDEIVVATSWETWQDYESPAWWDESFYRPESSARSSASTGGASTARASDGGTSAGTASTNTASANRASNEARRDTTADRDRELVTAQGGNTSPYPGGRAKPGDVVGVETGGETTHISDTKKDEDERRRDAERAAAKDRR